jgi:hypothetical protein
MQISKPRDLIERVAWTFIQVELTLGLLDWISSGINLSLVHTLYTSLGAAVAATIKVLIAQRIGSTGDGAAIPGGITK